MYVVVIVVGMSGACAFSGARSFLGVLILSSNFLLKMHKISKNRDLFDGGLSLVLWQGFSKQ
jgi:hypothetical protein